MKLTRDLVIIAVVCLGFYGWRHRLIPKPKPLFKGPAPTLAMPAPSNTPPRPDAGEDMLVEKESLGMPERHAPGQRSRPKTLGETPQLLSGDSAPSLDDNGPSPLTDDQPTWLDRAATPKGMAAVFGLFVLCYLILGRALKKGGGHHGFTHD
jgi:hypothetical protein